MSQFEAGESRTVAVGPDRVILADALDALEGRDAAASARAKRAARRTCVDAAGLRKLDSIARDWALAHTTHRQFRISAQSTEKMVSGDDRPASNRTAPWISRISSATPKKTPDAQHVPQQILTGPACTRPS